MREFEGKIIIKETKQSIIQVNYTQDISNVISDNESLKTIKANFENN